MGIERVRLYEPESRGVQNMALSILATLLHTTAALWGGEGKGAPGAPIK